MNEIPKPVRWVNYPGDLVASFTIGELKGPNGMGEMMSVVSVDYDDLIDQTRVGFSFQRVVPDE